MKTVVGIILIVLLVAFVCYQVYDLVKAIIMKKKTNLKDKENKKE